MTLILNILWFIFGGFLSWLLWILLGCLLFITVIGIPFGYAAFRIAVKGVRAERALRLKDCLWPSEMLPGETDRFHLVKCCFAARCADLTE